MELAAKDAEETIREADDKLFKAKVELGDVMKINKSVQKACRDKGDEVKVSKEKG